jgi:hypothetical protein
MHLVPNKSGRLVHQVDPVLEPVFEIRLMTLRDWNSIGDNDHFVFFLCELDPAGALSKRAPRERSA